MKWPRGDAFLGKYIMKTKKAVSVEEQLEKIKSRGCTVSDEECAKQILSRINYYRLSAYFLHFKKEKNKYIGSVSFEKVYRIYEFDKKIRCLIFALLETVEVLFKTKISFHHSSEHDALGYLEVDNFDKKYQHSSLLEKIENYIKKNKQNPIIIHHNTKYNGNFPLWVIIEFFDFSVLSKFYSGMKLRDQKLVAKDLEINQDYLKSWLYCLTHLRNCCAHHVRLYNNQMVSVPKTPKNFEYCFEKSVFDYIVVIKMLIGNSKEWKIDFLLILEELINEYQEDVEIKLLGFKEDWKKILSSEEEYVYKKTSLR